MIILHMYVVFWDVMGFKQYKNVRVRVVVFCFGDEHTGTAFNTVCLRLEFFFSFLNLVSFAFLGRPFSARYN